MRPQTNPHLVNEAKTPLVGSIRAREEKRKRTKIVTTQKDVCRGKIRNKKLQGAAGNCRSDVTSRDYRRCRPMRKAGETEQGKA